MSAWFAARRHETPEVILKLAREAEALAGFDGNADEQVFAFAGAAVGYAAAGEDEAASQALACARAKMEALSHLTVLSNVLPMAQQEMQRLRR